METNSEYHGSQRISFQKPAFEQVWKHAHFTAAIYELMFQKPAFEQVWKLKTYAHRLVLIRFQKPAFEQVWKLEKNLLSHLGWIVSEACI